MCERDDEGGVMKVKGIFAVDQLLEIQRKALRRRIWFKVLDKVERAIISLTIRCVDSVRSPKLAKILKAIVIKLREAMKGKVYKLMEKVGLPLAKKLGAIARSWGNLSALSWARDSRFIHYLTIMHMNTPTFFKVCS